MSDEDPFGGTPPSQTKHFCKVAETIEAYPWAAKGINDPRWSAPAIVKVLDDKGISLSSSSVRNHRTEKCSCYRGASR